MQARLAVLAPEAAGRGEHATGPLPPELHAGYSAAMAQSMLLPAAVLAIGLVAVLCFARPRRGAAAAPAPAVAGD
jgi:hypothetical protein